MQLITYADRLAGDLAGLKKLLDDELNELFSGVHILPFFEHIDGADAGFDPVDHSKVDSTVGTWEDIKSLSQSHILMADLIVNHMSDSSKEFLDVRRQGRQSPFWPLFLKRSDVFGEEPDLEQEALVFRPRPTPAFTTISLDDGSTYDFWTTFSHNQLDINVDSAEGRQYLRNIINRFHEFGVTEIRLDAAGFAVKRAGTRCFMLDETFNFIEDLSKECRELGMSTLVEIHSHYSTQIEIANRVGRVYDFALPPLMLHAFYQRDFGPLKTWLNISPRNCVTVLDTHDGIGILDVARDHDKPGLLNDAQIDSLVESIHQISKGESRKASGGKANNLDVYQVNCTFFDALGRQTGLYLMARAIQFFCPGEPQVYYVGLFAGKNDMDLLSKTQVGRDINRHYFSKDEISAELKSPAFNCFKRLIKLRNSSTAFDGEFSLESSSDVSIRLCWVNGLSRASLDVDLDDNIATIIISEGKLIQSYKIDKNGLQEL